MVRVSPLQSESQFSDVNLGRIIIDIKVFAYDPGFTISNLSSHNTAEAGARSAEESAKPLVDVIEGKRDDEVGQFLHNSGTYPW